MSTNAFDVAQRLFEQLQAAWNDADGAAFGAPFTNDADFVDIRGAHHATRAAIAAGHEAIFESIYKASRVEYVATDARVLTPGCIVMHATGTLDTPSGPVAGTHEATMTAVAVERAGSWEIAAFQNTIVAH
jgi:uncharacterized protein (TIGR02246 family)